VDDDHIGASARQNAADRGRHPKPAFRRDELLDRRARCRKACRIQLLIPGRHHDCATIARELVGQVLTIGHVDDRACRIMAEPPCRKRDRCGERFEMTRGDANDQSVNLALLRRLKLRRQDLNVPIRQKGRARIELREAAQQEGIEIGAQRCLIFGRVNGVHDASCVSRRCSSRRTISSPSARQLASACGGRASLACDLAAYALRAAGQGAFLYSTLLPPAAPSLGPRSCVQRPSDRSWSCEFPLLLLTAV
jgi:hypothetical protein